VLESSIDNILDFLLLFYFLEDAVGPLKKGTMIESSIDDVLGF
jgi:hypothetical protein